MRNDVDWWWAIVFQSNHKKCSLFRWSFKYVVKYKGTKVRSLRFYNHLQLTRIFVNWFVEVVNPLLCTSRNIAGLLLVKVQIEIRCVIVLWTTMGDLYVMCLSTMSLSFQIELFLLLIFHRIYERTVYTVINLAFSYLIWSYFILKGKFA